MMGGELGARPQRRSTGAPRSRLAVRDNGYMLAETWRSIADHYFFFFFLEN